MKFILQVVGAFMLLVRVVSAQGTFNVTLDQDPATCAPGYVYIQCMYGNNSIYWYNDEAAGLPSMVYAGDDNPPSSLDLGHGNYGVLFNGMTATLPFTVNGAPLTGPITVNNIFTLDSTVISDVASGSTISFTSDDTAIYTPPPVVPEPSTNAFFLLIPLLFMLSRRKALIRLLRGAWVHWQSSVPLDGSSRLCGVSPLVDTQKKMLAAGRESVGAKNNLA